MVNHTPTYLSVDIDFFGCPMYAECEEVEEFLEALFKTSVDANIPIHSMMNHNQMLQYVDASQARRLINLDAHSDLADKNIDELNIGTWISYVKWRKNGEYIWVRNERDTYPGECGYQFTDRQNHQTDWKIVKTYCPRKIPSMDLIRQLNIVGIGVCLSPAFCESYHECVFTEWVKRNKIPYKTGLRNEHNSCLSICPS